MDGIPKLKKQSLVLGLIFLFVLSLNLITQEVLADEADNKKVEAVQKKNGFAIEVIPPDTQIDKKFTFFYVHTKPNEEQTLKVRIRSTREEKTTVLVSMSNAATNTYGNIDYGQVKKAVDKSMDIPLTEMVKPLQDKLTVENYEEKIVELRVTPPDKEYTGVRLGAVSFQAAEDTDTKKKGIANTYAYRIAVMLSNDLKPYNRGGDLVYKHVGPRLEAGQKVIDFTLQNPNPFVLDELSLSTILTKKGNNEVLASSAREYMSVAPNSEFSFLTHLGIEDLNPGTYVLTVDGHDEDKHEWHWKKEFTITGAKAKKLNKEAAYKILLPQLYKYIGILLTLLTVGNIGYLIWRRSADKHA